MPPTERTNANPAAIKDLFAEVLEARELQQPDESDRVLREAKPDIRKAVEQLLEAHDRASGSLLDETVIEETSDRPSPLMQIASALAPPSIAGYEIHEAIGEGGFGIVYTAQQRKPIDRPVAVKVLRRELVSEDAIARFRAESALLARMSHESIAKVYDAGLTDQDQPFVAMQLIEGLPITEACKLHKLDARARVKIMASVCDAIQHAHQRAVIHRDLKPANILVESHPEGPKPRIIDFGIAKLLEDNPSTPHTKASVRMGTPRYMSPEQREGTETADTRVDVYALGAMLCELLAGDVPTAIPGQSRAGSRTSSDSNTKTNPSNSRITRPSRIAPEHAARTTIHPKTLRGDLDRIVLKACAADPELRYASAQAMGDDLRNYLQGRPINAAPPSVIYVTKKLISRHRATVSLAAVLGLALIGALAYAMISASDAKTQRDRAVASAERTAFIGDFLLDMLVLSADATARGAPAALTDGTLQKIADRAAEGLEEDPEHMLNMLEGIGLIQAQADQPQAGAANLARALEFAITQYPPPSPRVIDLRVQLHDLYWGHGLEGWKEQITLADQESAQLYDEDDPKRMRVVQRADGSLENLERIIARYDQLDNIEPTDRYHALFAYTMLQRFGPTPEKQLNATARLYEIAQEYYPPDHSALIDAMALHAEAMIDYAPSDQTVELLLDAYKRANRVLGPDHFTTEAIRRGLARIYGVLNRPEEGIPYALTDLESVAKVKGTDSIQYANALFELGRLYLYAEHLESARETLDHSLSLRTTQWSAGHSQITSVQIVLAQVLLALGEDTRAEQLCADAVTHLTQKRHAKNYASATRVRIALRERMNDTDSAQALHAQASEHLTELGHTPEEITELLSP